MGLRLKTRQKIALARAGAAMVLGARRLSGRGAQATVRRGGIRWQLDLREGLDFSIYLLGAFDRRTQRQYAEVVRPGDVVLDIGANIGAHTLPLARLVGPDGRVHAFEPTAFAHQKLCANLALNPDLASRVVVEQLMLEATVEATAPPAIMASWPVAGDGRSDSLHGGRAKSTEGAGMTTVDAYIDDRGLSRIDFIKLDVDGYECRVLRGATAMLSRFRPIVVLEIAPWGFDPLGESFAEFIGLWRDAGYRLFTSPDCTGALPMDAATLVAEIPHGASINAWAHPA